MTAQRDVVLGNVFNVRDLGGLATVDGRAVRPGRVFRAASLHQLDPAYAEDWERLAIRTVIDLRRHRERVAGDWPDLLNSATVCELPMLPEDWLLDRSGFGSAQEHLSAVYDDMQRVGMVSIRASFDLLADPASYPLLFFCVAGKDRTGLLAALLLLVLGVSDDDMLDDYELSGDRVIALVESLRAQGRLDGNPMINQPVEALRAPRAALAGSLARLRARHGSVAAYLASCGIGPEVLQAIRDNLVAERVESP